MLFVCLHLKNFVCMFAFNLCGIGLLCFEYYALHLYAAFVQVPRFNTVIF
jgi:hypothetical protein